MFRKVLPRAIIALAATLGTNAATAEELRLLSPVALRAAMPEIAAHFEASSGHKLLIDYATAGAIADRLRKGEAVDVAIASTTQIDDLLGQGRIAAGTRSQFARVGIGVFVRIKSPKPDLTSIESFKRALLEAQAVGYGDPARGGVSGTVMAALVERLGIAPALQARTRLYTNSQAVLSAVAAGDVSIGIGLTSDTVLAAGVDLAGGLPAELQSFTYYAGGVVVDGKRPEIASRFIALLTSPPVRTILGAKGFEPQ